MKVIPIHLLVIIFMSNFILADARSFGIIPVQDEGRIKPFDTFAENKLLSIYGKRSLKNPKKSATEWLLELLIYPEESYDKKVFKLTSPAMAAALSLDWRTPHLYSYNEVSDGINKNQEYFMRLYSMEEDSKNLIEKQLSDLFINVVTFKHLSGSFSCIDPVIKITDESIASALGTTVGSNHSYIYILTNISKLVPLMNELIDKPKKERGELDTLLMSFNNISKDNYSTMLKIVPSGSRENLEWISIWELVNQGSTIEKQRDIIKSLEEYIHAYKTNNHEQMDLAITEYINLVSTYEEVNMNLIEREVSYNKSDLFIYSIAFYLIAFLLLAGFWISKLNIFNILSFTSLLIGLGYHGYGLLMRMIIMQRPPVSTLYESIIFVGFIGVLFSTIFERFRKDGIGILLASVVGAILHFVGFGYENDGDTLGVLVAVLNSNFWLATHVTTITIGYGATAVASLMGHVYFIIMLINKSKDKYLKELSNNMVTLNLVALFFMLFGTILGGIWADQSWGRFWGWDPKENAALMIVMWQLLMVHLRISGWIKPLGFALGMIINNIFLAFGWFGVNLLGVGLHSYGFTDSIATNLYLFIIFELWYGIAIYYLIKDTKNNNATT